MAHKVETMAYTNQVPWHGLGHYIAEAPTVDEMLRLAKLDWEVHRTPLVARTEDGVEVDVPGFAALRRDSDNSILDVVGSQYRPVQNADAFAFFREFVTAGSATMETAGSLDHGRYVWGLANLNASFKLAGNDEVKGYLLVASPHQQGKSLIVKFTTVRVVCNNTLTLALRGGTEFRMNHRATFSSSMVERAKETLGIARDQLSEFEANARKLRKLRLNDADAIRVLAPTFQPDSKTAEEIVADRDLMTPRLAAVIDAMYRAPGAQPGNGWGLLNAVTYYADHVASRTNDKRLTNAWLGKTARQKESVLATLLEMTD